MEFREEKTPETRSFWEHRAVGTQSVWQQRVVETQSFWKHRAVGTLSFWEQSCGNTELLETQSSYEHRAVGTQSFWEHRTPGASESQRGIGTVKIPRDRREWPAMPCTDCTHVRNSARNEQPHSCPSTLAVRTGKLVAPGLQQFTAVSNRHTGSMA